MSVSTHSDGHATSATVAGPVQGGHVRDRLWHRVALICAALLAPALLNEHGKGAAEALVVVILIGYARHLWLERGALSGWTQSSRLLALLWLWLNIVVSPLALDSGESFARTLGWFRMPTLAFALGAWVLRDRRSLMLVGVVWGGTVMAGVADGFWQLATGVSLSGHPMFGDRLTGPMERPNIGGFTARLGLPLLAAGLLLIPARRRGGRLVLSTLGLTGLVFVLLTGERTASIMLMASLGAALAWLVVRDPRARLPALATLIALAVLATLVVANSPRIQARVADTLVQVMRPQESIYTQIVVAAWEMAREHPFSGVGVHGYRDACPPLLEAGRVQACQPHPHNYYAEWLAECGFPALLAFVCFVLVFASELLRRHGVDAAGGDIRPWLLAALVMLLFPLQATQSFFDNRVGLMLWASLGITLAVARLAQSRRQAETREQARENGRTTTQLGHA
jgi:O-antigen ligase